MSRSWSTRAKIHRDFFPARGKTTLLDGKPVKRVEFDPPTPLTSFGLKDVDGNYLGLYFHGDGFLDFFDATAGNWDAEWMKDAILAAHRKRLSRLPDGPARMPRPPKPDYEKGFWGKVHKLNTLRPKEIEDREVLLPVTALEVPLQEFVDALTLHGLVPKVEGKGRNRVLSISNPHGYIGYEARPIGVLTVHDKVTDCLYVCGEPRPPMTFSLDSRSLPYDLYTTLQPLDLYWERPIFEGEDMKGYRFTFPLMGSTGIEDVAPEVKKVRAEKAEQQRIKGLDVENTKLKAKLTTQSNKITTLRRACLMRKRDLRNQVAGLKSEVARLRTLLDLKPKE